MSFLPIIWFMCISPVALTTTIATTTTGEACSVMPSNTLAAQYFFCPYCWIHVKPLIGKSCCCPLYEGTCFRKAENLAYFKLRLQLCHFPRESTWIELNCEKVMVVCKLLCCQTLTTVITSFGSNFSFCCNFRKKKQKPVLRMADVCKALIFQGDLSMNNILDDLLCFSEECLQGLQRLWTSLHWGNLYTAWIRLIWVEE